MMSYNKALTNLNNWLNVLSTCEYLLSNHYTFNGLYFDRHITKSPLTSADLQDWWSSSNPNGNAHTLRLT